MVFTLTQVTVYKRNVKPWSWCPATAQPARGLAARAGTGRFNANAGAARAYCTRLSYVSRTKRVGLSLSNRQGLGKARTAAHGLLEQRCPQCTPSCQRPFHSSRRTLLALSPITEEEKQHRRV